MPLLAVGQDSERNSGVKRVLEELPIRTRALPWLLDLDEDGRASALSAKLG
jgi:hypothetical protein